MALSNKTKKIINIVVDIIDLLILVVAVIFAVSIITSRVKGYDGYTEIFGKSYLAVKTDSMEGDSADSFNRYDLIAIRLVGEEEAKNLTEGQVVTFKFGQTGDGKYNLNTHRIVRVEGEGSGVRYYTKGDNPEASQDTGYRTFSDIVGVYTGEKIDGLGNFVIFMGSFGGFCTFVLVPSIIVVVYFAVDLVLAILKEKKKQTAAAAAESDKLKAEERERIRQEILAELSGGAKSADGQPVSDSLQNSDGGREVTAGSGSEDGDQDNKN